MESTKVIKMIILVIILASHNVVHSQRTITLSEAIKIALANNLELKQAKLDIDKAQATVDEVFGNALPSVDFTASYARIIKGQQVAMPDFAAIMQNAAYGILFQEKLLEYSADKIKEVGTSLMSMTQANTFQTQLQLTQILFNSAVFTGIGVSKDYLEVSKYQYNTKVSDIVMNVKQAFYGVLYTKALLDIINISYQNAQANLKNVQALSKEGLVSEFNLLDASVQVENIRPQIKQLENAVASATDGLKILLAIPQPENIEASGTIDYIEEELSDISALSDAAKRNNLQIQTLEQMMNINKAAISASEADYYPSIIGFANYGWTGMGNSFSDLSTFPTSQIGLQLSINLFKGLQTKYKVQNSKIDLQKNEEQVVQLKDAIEMQIRTNINELNRIKEDIAAQNRNINVAEKAYQLAQDRYKEGIGSQLEIQNSDLSLRMARRNRLESVYNYTNSKIKLDNLLGIISEEWKIK